MSWNVNQNVQAEFYELSFWFNTSCSETRLHSGYYSAYTRMYIWVFAALNTSSKLNDIIHCNLRSNPFCAVRGEIFKNGLFHYLGRSYQYQGKKSAFVFIKCVFTVTIKASKKRNVELIRDDMARLPLELPILFYTDSLKTTNCSSLGFRFNLY